MLIQFSLEQPQKTQNLQTFSLARVKVSTFLLSCFPINLSRGQPLHGKERINARSDKHLQSTYN